MSLFESSDVTAPWTQYAEYSLPPVLQAALTCFLEQGYHGTVVRAIAKTAGLSVPGIYHHYASKQAMLVELMQRAMRELYERSIQALEAPGDSITVRFESHITCLVLFHAHRSALAFVAASEIRSLEGNARDELIAARDRQQEILDRIIADGVEAGVFASENPGDASRAIVTMCTGVAQWFRVGGSLTAEQVAERYVVLARRALSA